MHPGPRTAVIGLSLLALGAAGAGGAEPLDFAGDLGDMLNASLSRRALALFAQRDEAIAALDTPERIETRQRFVREAFLDAIGGFPERTPLAARITRTLERDDYRVEMLVFESLPGFYVTANLYVPRTGGPRFPAVLGVAGHSAVGKASATYQHAWIALAKRGFLVLAYDPPGQGERSLYFDPDLGRSRVGIGTSEHTLSGLQALLTGHHFARYELWDGVRAVDYLLERGDVDPDRIAVAGNSGGGTQAAYLAVVEPRLAATVSSCYMTSWKQLWFDPGPQDAEQDLPGFLADGLDFGDYALAFAPRPFLIESATRDFFPIEGARATWGEVRGLYERLDAADAAGYFEYDDTHGWSKPRREAAYRWLDRWLGGAGDGGPEPEIATEHAWDLHATPTGQVATSFPGAETVQSLNRAVAEALYPGRTAAGLEDAGALTALVRERLRMGGTRAEARVRSLGTLGRDGVRVERVVLDTAPGIAVPALVFVPEADRSRKPALLYLHGEGKARDAGEGGDLEALARAGHVVLAPDLRGLGESRPATAAGGYHPEWQTLQRALLVDRTLVGLQLEDALAAFDVLAARDDVDADRVGVVGKGVGGILSLFLAALEPAVSRVAVEGSVVSYLAIARAPLHEGLTGAIVPGILRDLDLPDLAAAIAPRPLWITDPVSPTGALVAPDEVRDAYAPALRAYERAGARAALRVALRPEGRAMDVFYSDWLDLDPAHSDSFARPTTPARGGACAR